MPKVNELIGEVKALNTKVDSFMNEILNENRRADAGGEGALIKV